VSGGIVTDEELQNTVAEIEQEIEKLSASDNKPLSPSEKKRLRLLLTKKNVLEKIQQAKQSNNIREETEHSATYGLLCSYGDKHPLLLHFMKIKLRASLL
jgi:hypothetical protein